MKEPKEINETTKGVWREGDLVFDKIVFNGKVVEEEKEDREDGAEK